MTATTPEVTTPVKVPERKLYTLDEAAALLNLKRTKTFAELKAGRLKSVTVGRRRFIPADYLDDYVDLLKREASA
ncbi:hypothetical protein GCM10009799_03030 [Nocardiopsis rhodophaea]|uniref:Helix-turn-helix domain-containing protein n=1 Tax=Nocardiopsis rhodophaea TaxID=280238 RepID=A0ABN2S7E1_9ACTN